MMLDRSKPFDQMTPLEQRLFALTFASGIIPRAKEILAFLKGEDEGEKKGD